MLLLWGFFDLPITIYLRFYNPANNWENHFLFGHFTSCAFFAFKFNYHVCKHFVKQTCLICVENLVTCITFSYFRPYTFESVFFHSRRYTSNFTTYFFINKNEDVDPNLPEMWKTASWNFDLFHCFFYKGSSDNECYLEKKKKAFFQINDRIVITL